ncbi:MAG: nucleoside 2-deoxyribosyltransferase [Bacteroidetes bacterium]|nr:nucleoside 2-deoxyribosyltransferase [Bacteroidota bacterium]
MKQKIYCAGPISGDVTFQKSYRRIIKLVNELGALALHEPDLVPNTNLNDKEIYDRDIKWLEESKGVIAEVSAPSLGVGFEISYALFTLKKPVLALYSNQVKRLSAMIKGCDNNSLTVKCYQNEIELEMFVRGFLEDLLKKG